MSYTKTNWQTGDVISKARLNHAEQGIYDNAEDITALKNDLAYSVYKTTDISSNYTNGGYIALNTGLDTLVDMTPVSSVQRAYTVIPCIAGDSFLITAGGGSAPRAWGFTDTQYILKQVAASGANPVSVTITAEQDGYLIVNHDVTKNYSLIATQLIKALTADEASAITEDAVESNNTNVLGFRKINYFDKNSIIDGKYPNPTSGILNNNVNYFASEYIDVDAIGPTVIIYGSQYVHCYSADKTPLGVTPEADTRAQAKTQTFLEGTKYIIVSANYAYLDAMQVGESVTPGQSISFDNYGLSNLVVGSEQVIDDPIVVDINGGGDYTSFTLACKEHYADRRDIIVKPGTYDINAEYIAIWGDEAVSNMADSDSEIFDGWQYGVKMYNRKFTFEPGAKLICDRTNYIVNTTHRFSALRVEHDVEIIGLDLDCTHLFYCIHDDYGVQTLPYTNIYRNCRVIGRNLTNGNCIGGGCKKLSRHILENCYFDNNSNSLVAVRYHNTNQEGAVPEIFILNCFFNTYLAINYYGAQITKLRAYINNCSAKEIKKGAESSTFDIDNVEMFKWNNTETDLS